MKYTIDLNKVSLGDINLVGGKNASLGEMLQNLNSMNIKVPNGFAINVKGYFDYITHNKLDKKIKDLVSNLNDSDIIELRKVGSQVRQIIRNGEFPEELKNEIKEKYLELSKQYDQEMTDVAVRSSATAEDLPDASFAEIEQYLTETLLDMIILM